MRIFIPLAICAREGVSKTQTKLGGHGLDCVIAHRKMKLIMLTRPFLLCRESMGKWIFSPLYQNQTGFEEDV